MKDIEANGTQGLAVVTLSILMMRFSPSQQSSRQDVLSYLKHLCIVYSEYLPVEWMNAVLICIRKKDCLPQLTNVDQ